MADIKDRAREYIAEHSEYKEVLGETFVAVDTLNAMVGFAEQETKALKEQIEKMKRDVMCNVKWADQNKNEQMYCKLNAMINQWEIKENE
jgi:predicted sulfurtransferase